MEVSEQSETSACIPQIVSEQMRTEMNKFEQVENFQNLRKCSVEASLNGKSPA